MKYLAQKLSILGTLCATCFSASFAQQNTEASVPAQEVSIEEDDDFQRFAIVPVLGYSEETKFEYGLMGNFFFKPSFKGGRTSELDMIIFGTSEKQYSYSIAPGFYAFHDRLSGKVYFFFENWESNFYGIGNDPDIDDYRRLTRETYFSKGIIESNFLLPESMSAFKYGFSYIINKSKFDFHDYEGEIEVPTDFNGWRNGLGYRLTYDTRDNTNWARHGHFIQWEQTFYPGAISDYDMYTQSLDLRGYSEFIWNTSMAAGFLWQRVEGDVPFDMLVGSDGTRRFRGVKSNYFCENQALFLQSEFRKKLFWRLAGNIFFEGGKVGDHFSELMRNKWHTGLGFGGQFAINPGEDLYARADISLVDFDHIGVTFFLREAF